VFLSADMIPGYERFFCFQDYCAFFLGILAVVRLILWGAGGDGRTTCEVLDRWDGGLGFGLSQWHRELAWALKWMVLPDEICWAGKRVGAEWRSLGG
jgi:hypothetical protein